MEAGSVADHIQANVSGVPLGGVNGGVTSSAASPAAADDNCNERGRRDSTGTSGGGGNTSDTSGGGKVVCGGSLVKSPSSSSTSSSSSSTSIRQSPGGSTSSSKEGSRRYQYPDLDHSHVRRAAEANGYSPTRLQYLKAMSQIKGAAKRIEREEKVQVLKRLGDFFSESDKNGDGQLTINELTKNLRRCGYRGSDAEIKKFFRLADVSDDQLISKEEFMNVMLKAPTLVHREMTMRRVFTKFDKDGNGSIDKDELKLVFEELGKLMPEEEITRMMSMADKDDSGALEYEEFIEIVIGNRRRREEYEKTPSQDSS